MITKQQTETTLCVQRRFFDALDAIIQNRQLKGLKTFCTSYGLNRTKYSRLRESIRTNVTGQYHNIDIDALAYIVTDYGINAAWLLTGNGDMFTSKQQHPGNAHTI